MKTFKFTCKQNQVVQVVKLLNDFTGRKCHVCIVNGFPVVTVKHNMSNRKIDKHLFTNNVPGSNPRKNRYKIVKCHLFELSCKVPANTWVKWANPSSGKLTIVKFDYVHSGCDCCGWTTRVLNKNNRVLY